MVTSIESPSSLEPERPTTVPCHLPATIWKLVMGTVVAGGGGGAEVQPAIVTASTTIRRPSMRIEVLLTVCRPPPQADRQGEVFSAPGRESNPRSLELRRPMLSPTQLRAHRRIIAIRRKPGNFRMRRTGSAKGTYPRSDGGRQHKGHPDSRETQIDLPGPALAP